MERKTPQEALQALLDGNARFVKGNPTLIDTITANSREAVEAQSPIACLLTCSDARLPPQIFFDRALGDLFIIRVAGGILDEVVLSTIAFSILDLGVPLVLVMGHSRCGAIKAAIDGDTRPHLQPLVKRIAPAIARAKERTGDYWLDVTEENAFEITADLKKPHHPFHQLYKEGKLGIRSAIYHLESGKVELLD